MKRERKKIESMQRNKEQELTMHFSHLFLFFSYLSRNWRIEMKLMNETRVLVYPFFNEVKKALVEG